ncbi:MAG TPA: ThiF family adenylyltransferase [Thermoplasmata archaeon]|nr:ThiF family adenylyltransferase [Thermoplasmata archaeon]
MEGVIRPGTTDEDRFDRSRRIEWLDVDAVFRTRVLMVGAGALGNEVGKNLALSGFRKVTIVDMDRVVGSNLNRCLFFNMEDSESRKFKAEVLARGMEHIGDGLEAEVVTEPVERVSPDIFTRHDIILGCLDNIVARMHVNSHSYHANRPYVDGGMDGLLGKVAIVRPPEGPCLQCGMNSSHARVAGIRFSCTGADVVFHEPRLAAEITTTSVISAVMVREALKFASGREDLLLSNAFYYDGRRNVSEELEISLDPSCPVHAK